jgi:HlyD family secretion protein
MRLMFLPLAVVSVLVFGCGSKRDGISITASGHIEATEVRLSTKVGGTVIEIGAQEGDRVSKGQTIARLDTKDTELAIASARADQGQVSAQLDLLLAGARAEDIADAEAQGARCEVEHAAAKRDSERMEGLHSSGSGTEKQRDDARMRRDVAATTLASARERLAKLKAGAREEEIRAARARLSAAEARVAQLDQQIKDAVIASPVDGILTERLVEPGELVARQGALAMITDLRDARLLTYVPETDLGRIQLGQKVEVVTDDGQKRGGTLAFISPKAEFTPKNVQTRDERVKLVYKIKIRLANEDGLFKPGMPAEARIPVKTAS